LGCVGPHVAEVGRKLPAALDARVVLLRQNAETIIETLRAGPMAAAVPAITFGRALAKDRSARDIVFATAARLEHRGAREHLAEKLPDFAYLVQQIRRVAGGGVSEGQ